MCGRYQIVTNAQALYDAFQVEAEFAEGWLARYNVAPATDQLVIVEEEGGRAARWHRWGLIPHWAKDAAIAYKTINARGESVAAKPAYRAAFRQRRCLVPATGFYEWKALADAKQPYLIRLSGGGLFAFAGLCERWAGPEGEVRSFTIITTAPNVLMTRIYHRMPAIIPRAHYARWLDPAVQDPAQIQTMIASYPDGALQAVPIGRQINNARNQGPELIEPVGAPLD